MNSHTLGRYAMQYLLESQTPKKGKDDPSGPPSQTVKTTSPPQEPRRWWSRRPRPEDILTKEERKILKAVKSRAHFLDRGFSCCCIQIGFDGLIGFIPVVGDFIGLIFAMFLVEKAMEAHLPSKLINQMLINIAVDFFVGLVPIIGDILDIMYKCNTRNALLLEEYLIQRRQYQLRKQDIDTTYIPKSTSSATNIHHRGNTDSELQPPPMITSKSTTAVATPSRKK
ncbi:hypothetical protein BC941DRAFT_441625 [Chlamydoabsidia padenii]|nr:hypothetical protein BC941DRAFT_441625 [Chlamydoabsidia padenii]